MKVIPNPGRPIPSQRLESVASNYLSPAYTGSRVTAQQPCAAFPVTLLIVCNSANRHPFALIKCAKAAQNARKLHRKLIVNHSFN